jgi:hypothetical protein
MSDRAKMAARYLEILRSEYDVARINQDYQGWLYYATAGEVRKHWRKWMGPFPAWAKKQ